MAAPVPAADPGLAGLRDALAGAGYTLEGIADCLGEQASSALHREQSLPAERVTAGLDSPVAVLVRLLALGLPVPVGRLDGALAGWDTARLAAAGLVEVAGGQARTLFDLRPYADDAGSWWVLSDLSEVMTGRPLDVDHVLGIGGASTTLASWTPRRTVDRALDLGAGCGVQSLHLSRHAGAVVGTDTSARALAVAAANAALNELDWDLRRGDLLEPVAGERFGLVVSNPPFVITPRTAQVPTYTYRDGGRVGHALVARLVGDLAAHLEPGGVAQLLANWEVPAGGRWTDVVGGWLDGTGLDAWVVERDSQDPAQYAELWAGDGGHRAGTPGFEQMYGAWLDDFAARGVERVGFGVLTLQRPQGRREPFHDLVSATGPLAAPMGPVVDAGLRARTWLAEHGDTGLLGRAWRCAGDVTEERFGRPGASDPSVIRLRQGGGLGRVVRLGTAAAAFVSVADGQLTAGAALDAIASLLGVSPQAVRDEVLPVARELVADGLLLPAG